MEARRPSRLGDHDAVKRSAQQSHQWPYQPIAGPPHVAPGTSYPSPVPSASFLGNSSVRTAGRDHGDATAGRCHLVSGLANGTLHPCLAGRAQTSLCSGGSRTSFPTGLDERETITRWLLRTRQAIDRQASGSLVAVARPPESPLLRRSIDPVIGQHRRYKGRHLKRIGNVWQRIVSSSLVPVRISSNCTLDHHPASRRPSSLAAEQAERIRDCRPARQQRGAISASGKFGMISCTPFSPRRWM